MLQVWWYTHRSWRADVADQAWPGCRVCAVLYASYRERGCRGAAGSRLIPWLINRVHFYLLYEHFVVT